jgi:hypothetical protein
MSFVPNGYLSIREALNRLGRELFPSEWTGEEYRARRGLISEEEWLRIKDLPPARGGGAQGSGPRIRSTLAAKPGVHSSGDPSDPSYQEEYRARQRHVDAQQRLRQLLEAGQLEAANIGSIYRGVASSDHSTMATAQCRSADRKGASANTAQFQHGFSPGQAIRRIKCGHQADSTGKNPRSNRSPEEKIGDGKSDAV